MEEDGIADQSNQDRRELRKQYRNLQDIIHNKTDDISGSVKGTAFDELHGAVNELFQNVNHVRELGIDADALTAMARGLKGQASKLGDISSSFNAQTFSRWLVSILCFLLSYSDA